MKTSLNSNPANTNFRKQVLVIKHGALGDVILALGAMKAIRDHHKNANIICLTTPAYAGLLKKSGLFDTVWEDKKPKFWQPLGIYNLYKLLNSETFDCVYDLQTSQRTGLYYKYISDPKPKWVGVAKGCSHFHDNPDRKKIHTLERQQELLGLAGIQNIPAPQIDFLQSDIEKFSLPDKYCLIVPGGAAHRPEKRWPPECYAHVVGWCLEEGVRPVLIGGESEAAVCDFIEAAQPRCINLNSVTTFEDIASLSRRAIFALGNDTGPMHIANVAGCKTIVLFSDASDPALCAPRGDQVTILHKPGLASLSVDEVIEKLSKCL